jgi:hypothetical protein
VYNPRRNAGNRVTIGRSDASLIGIPNGRAAVDNTETKVDNDVLSRAAAYFGLVVTIIIEMPPFPSPGLRALFPSASEGTHAILIPQDRRHVEAFLIPQKSTRTSRHARAILSSLLIAIPADIPISFPIACR